MPVKTHCPCCGSKHIGEHLTINTNDIVTLYNRQGISTAPLFTNIPTISLVHCEDCTLKFFNPPVAGDEDFYNQLQKMEWYFAHPDKTEFPYSASFIKPNDKVLDVGSGRGVWASYFRGIEGVAYQGIEFSSKSIELAQQDGVNVIKESVQDHAQRRAAYYDMVGTFQVLEHVEDIQGFVTACLACVKPGGRFVVAVPNNDGFIRNMVNNWLNVPPHHINHWNEKSLRKLGEKFQLEIESVKKEEVTNIHKELFFTIYAYNKISKFIGYKKKMIDTSFSFRLMNKIAYLRSKSLIKRSEMDKREDGHTIIVVFRKPLTKH